MESKVICTYGDCLYINHDNKTYMVSTDYMEVEEVEEVARITLTGNETDEELFDGLLIDKNIVFDSCGELDNSDIYCYWRHIDTK